MALNFNVERTIDIQIHEAYEHGYEDGYKRGYKDGLEDKE